MKYDLLIKNGTVVLSDRNLNADVAIKDGKVAAVGKRGSFTEAGETIDVAGKYVLPGIIDIHCHFRDPGMTQKEDFSTGTMSAAFGGVTTIFDMPNTAPPVATSEIMAKKIEAIEKKAYVDFCLWGTVVGNDISHIQELADNGVVGFKIFIGETTGSLPSPEEGALFEAFKLIRETGLRVGIHAEDRGFVNYFTNKFKQENKNDYQSFDYARGNTAEALAIARLLVISKAAGNKLHIVHMSTKEGVNLVSLARAQGVDVSAETCPQYLVLQSEDFDKIGQIIKVYPPVRYKEDIEVLWKAIHEGTVQIIASDHAPHVTEEKLGPKNIWDVPAGVSVVESSVAVMLNEINKGRMTLNEYVKATSENPARLFNLYPRKGSIQVGSDADITIVDMDKEMEISAKDLHYKNKYTVYEGYKVKGLPVYTIVRGNIVMANGKIAKEPVGMFVNPRKR